MGREMHGHVQKLIDQLQDRQNDAQWLLHLSGYGGLDSANDMRRKYEANAQAYIDILDKHIEILTTMDDTYTANIKDLHQQDAATAGNLSSIHPGGK